MPYNNIQCETWSSGRKFNLTGKRDPKAAIELYDNGRFFTFTGKQVPGTPDTINSAQEDIYALIKELDAAKGFKNTTSKSKAQGRKKKRGPSLSDDELIEKASSASNAEKFASLFVDGDSNPYGGNWSCADQALCDILAFWTGKNSDQMDRIFRRSALMRPKWDELRGEDTYGNMTIAEAIRTCTETYSGRETNKNGLPDLVMEGQLREQMADCMNVLVAANEKKLSLFIYLSIPSKVTTNENNRPDILQMKRGELLNELTYAANFYARYVDAKGVEHLSPVDPPRDVADQLLALEVSRWPVPALRSIVESPVLRPDGSILDMPGYDATTRLYYMPSESMKDFVVPKNPTQEDALAALEQLKPLFCNFPYEGPSDHANLWALLLTPFVRYAVKGDIQMCLIDATNPGTGKGLLANSVSLITTGNKPTIIAEKEDENEWRKSILTELLKSPSILVVDNVRGVLESSTLEMILTSSDGGFSERILGQSRSAHAKNEATWIATGNNLLIGGDLGRRCYRIRLISKTAHPDERPDSDFTIADLEGYIHEHRCKIVTAVLTICRAWFVAGRPPAMGVPNMGTFSNWAKTIGGILEFVGITEFQQNRAELRSRNNEEASEWETFLTKWFATFGDEWKHADEIAKALTLQIDTSGGIKINPPQTHLLDALPKFLKKSLAEKPHSFSVTLAIALGKRVQTVYGSDAYRIEKGDDKHKKSNAWRVVREVAGTSQTPNADENI